MKTFDKKVYCVLLFNFRSGPIYVNEAFDLSTMGQDTEENVLNDVDADSPASTNTYDTISDVPRPSYHVTYSNKDSVYAGLEIHAEYENTSHIYNTLK